MCTAQGLIAIKKKNVSRIMIYFILFVCLLFISNVKNVFNGLLKKNKNWPLFSQKSSLLYQLLDVLVH